MHMQVGATLKPQKKIRRRSEITSLQFHTCLKVEKNIYSLALVADWLKQRPHSTSRAGTGASVTQGMVLHKNDDAYAVDLQSGWMEPEKDCQKASFSFLKIGCCVTCWQLGL